MYVFIKYNCLVTIKRAMLGLVLDGVVCQNRNIIINLYKHRMCVSSYIYFSIKMFSIGLLLFKNYIAARSIYKLLYAKG